MGVAAFILAVLSVPQLFGWYYDIGEKLFGSGTSPIKKTSCPRVFDRAHRILATESPLAAPPDPGVAFTPSADLPGRVDLTLTWINAVPVTQGAVAMQGVYGAGDPIDYFIDHSEPAAATGECWNWYHYVPGDDAQPKKVYIRVYGLWPEQQYCFYTVYRISGGYSRPSPIMCQTATWKSAWGKPAQAPSK
ncbi:MAG: hypothetical protein DLM57_08035 [Pseudonocardiales bacterium]|nr:MAG: hypothetical protein DLM57_08035 [Pseudonocardiales bacterium]